MKKMFIDKDPWGRNWFWMIFFYPDHMDRPIVVPFRVWCWVPDIVAEGAKSLDFVQIAE